MAIQTEPGTGDDTMAQSSSPVAALVGGALVGIIGGAIMGPIWVWFRPFILLEAVPAMYNLQGSLAGWVAHAVHSILFGALFTLLVTRTALASRTSSFFRRVGFGIVYGISLWIIAAGIVFPLALSISDFLAAPLVPNLHPSGLVAHLIYGTVVGALSWPVVGVLDRVL